MIIWNDFCFINDKEDRSFVIFVSIIFHWLFMTSTKWFALGSFASQQSSPMLVVLLVQHLLNDKSQPNPPPEIVATENRSSAKGSSARSHDDVPQMKENTYRALSIEVSLILPKQAQRSST